MRTTLCDSSCSWHLLTLRAHDPRTFFSVRHPVRVPISFVSVTSLCMKQQGSWNTHVTKLIALSLCIGAFCSQPIPAALSADAPATTYTVTGPTTLLPQGNTFQVTPDGLYSGTITPSDGGAGGTFVPASLHFNNSADTQAFTYNMPPGSAAAVTIAPPTVPIAAFPLSRTLRRSLSRRTCPTHSPTILTRLPMGTLILRTVGPLERDHGWLQTRRRAEER